ncbi:MAG: TSUP family transporter, partial [Burkholderiaceae bacterium]|nr:TSUP family transporter [Burkholderiaceae bacterium]
MTDWTLTSSIAILSAAGFIHGLFGIGFAMIATPLLALFLDYRAAVLLAALPLLLMAASWLLVHRDLLRGCGLPGSLLPAIAVGATVGAVLQASLPEQVSLILLAAALTGSVVLSFLLERPRAARRPLAGWAPLAFGTLAGVTESALNVGATFMVLYGALARLDRIRALIALNVCFALGKTIQIGL